MNNQKIYSEQDIIEKALVYNRLVELRTKDISLYHLIRRREMLDMIRELMLEKPRKKRVKNGEAIKREKRIKEPKKPEEPKPARIRKQPLKELDDSSSKKMYRAIRDGDSIICGRCLMNAPRTKRSNLCKECYRVYTNCQVNCRRNNTEEKPHVPWNVKQRFCNTKITHHEKTFLIGIKVDERTQAYLTAIGYAFIFQEPWENIWDWKQNAAC